MVSKIVVYVNSNLIKKKEINHMFVTIRKKKIIYKIISMPCPMKHRKPNLVGITFVYIISSLMTHC